MLWIYYFRALNTKPLVIFFFPPNSVLFLKTGCNQRLGACCLLSAVYQSISPVSNRFAITKKIQIALLLHIRLCPCVCVPQLRLGEWGAFNAVLTLFRTAVRSSIALESCVETRTKSMSCAFSSFYQVIS